MGVHCGLAYPRGDGYVAMAVHQAARVVAAAHGGQVLVSEQVEEAARGVAGIGLTALGRFRLRDFDAPVRLFQVVGERLPDEFPSVRALPAEGHNLVRPPTNFVGRDDALAAVNELLGPGRVVSVVGPGGMGKTRLVTELGLRVAPGWPDGVWFIDLSVVREAALIPATVAAAVGCPVAADEEPWPAVLTCLCQQEALLIFDNCEHLIEGAARHVADVTRECPSVGVLATSREPLGLQHEQVWRLAPLPTTGPSMTPATELFAARARAVRPAFELDATSTPIVTAICNRLDGLPLAIELAAARVAVLSPAEILAGLEDRFRLLRNRDRTVAERQRTLEALLDWSYKLLSVGEQAALRRLGVFAASFDVETATAALADDTLDAYDVPELIWALADKSLISVEPSANATRYRLLDSIRAFALGRLDDRGEVESTAARIADWYLKQLGPWVPVDALVMSLTTTEIDNLRGLIPLTAKANPARAQCLACSIPRFHRNQGTVAAGVVETQHELDRTAHAGPERVELLSRLVDLLAESGDAETALQVADEVAVLGRAVGPPAWSPHQVEYALCAAFLSSGDNSRVVQIVQHALSTANDDNTRSWLLNKLGLAANALGDLKMAYDAGHEALVLDKKNGWDMSAAVDHGNLAEAEIRRGAFAAAAQHQRVTLEVAAQTGMQIPIAFSMVLAARLEGHHARWSTGVRLHAKADSMLGRLGFVMMESDRRLSAEMLHTARGQLGETAYDAERRVGEQLSLPEAIELTDAVLLAVAAGD